MNTLVIFRCETREVDAMQFRDIDRDSASDRSVLAELAAQHGPRLAEAARDLARLFLIGSPWAPGLWFVGGQTAHAPFGPAGVFNVAGAGLTLIEALASCAGEAVERVGQIERVTDVVKSVVLGPALEISGSTRAFAQMVLKLGGGSLQQPIDWVVGQDLNTGRTVDVPADWVLRRTPSGPLRMPGCALSTGAAAGPTTEFAAQRAILELVERDASSLWWQAGRPARKLALDAPDLTAAAQCLKALRRDAHERQTRLLDITTDVDIPVVVAISTDADGRAFAAGLGCRTTLAAATVAALMELAQTETGLQLSMLKREQMGDAALSDGDRRHLARAEACRADAMADYAAPTRDTAMTGLADAAAMAKHLAAQGIEVAIVPLARGGVSMVKAVAVDLQLFPGNIETARLRRAKREFGGAAHWNQGVSLF
jgi:ribosomal protein S12 methylthiotransferase accessory factor